MWTTNISPLCNLKFYNGYIEKNLKSEILFNPLYLKCCYFNINQYKVIDIFYLPWSCLKSSVYFTCVAYISKFELVSFQCDILRLLLWFYSVDLASNCEANMGWGGLRMQKGLFVGLAGLVECLCVLLLPQDALAFGPLTHVLATIVFCGLRDLILARFPGTVPTFLCASFLSFQLLACHCNTIQCLDGRGSNELNPKRKLDFLLFIWDHEQKMLVIYFQRFIELELI